VLTYYVLNNKYIPPLVKGEKLGRKKKEGDWCGQYCGDVTVLASQ
jgi:hypothetical protein